MFIKEAVDQIRKLAVPKACNICGSLSFTVLEEVFSIGLAHEKGPERVGRPLLGIACDGCGHVLFFLPEKLGFGTGIGPDRRGSGP